MKLLFFFLSATIINSNIFATEQFGQSMGIDGYGQNKGRLLNAGMGFCTPNIDETECTTIDGRVYRLVKSINQAGRQIQKQIDKSSKVPNNSENSGQ